MTATMPWKRRRLSAVAHTQQRRYDGSTGLPFFFRRCWCAYCRALPATITRERSQFFSAKAARPSAHAAAGPLRCMLVMFVPGRQRCRGCRGCRLPDRSLHPSSTHAAPAHGTLGLTDGEHKHQVGPRRKTGERLQHQGGNPAERHGRQPQVAPETAMVRQAAGAAARHGWRGAAACSGRVRAGGHRVRVDGGELGPRRQLGHAARRHKRRAVRAGVQGHDLGVLPRDPRVHGGDRVQDHALQKAVSMPKDPTSE